MSGSQLPMLTHSRFPSMLDFQKIRFSCTSTSDSVMTIMLSAFRSSQGHPVQNSWERASRTVMNSRELRHEPKMDSVSGISHLLRMRRISHSSMPSLWSTHKMMFVVSLCPEDIIRWYIFNICCHWLRLCSYDGQHYLYIQWLVGCLNERADCEHRRQTG